MHRCRSRGFTLIELLIVIAIIGVLSSILLSSLNGARVKADDAVTKAQLAMIRNAANLFYAIQNPNSYNGSSGDVRWRCDESGSMFIDVASGMAGLLNQSNYHSSVTLRCSSNPNAYQVSASLRENRGGSDPDFWCVNSAGVSKIIEDNNHSQAHKNNDVDCTP